MRIRKTTGHGGDGKIDLQMTPMIDIVFQLLIFFIMTFKIAPLEGDFNIKMPVSAPKQGEPDPDKPVPIHVKMTSNTDGTLSGLQINQNPALTEAPFSKLQQFVIEQINKNSGSTGPNSFADEGEVELDCDYNLHYEYVMRAIDAVSGRRADDGTVARLMQKIKFTAPKKNPKAS